MCLFVLILLAFFFPLATKLIGQRTRCQFFKGAGHAFGDSFCRTVRCLSQILYIFFPPWPLSSWVRERGVNSLKNVDFSVVCSRNSISKYEI